MKTTPILALLVVLLSAGVVSGRNSIAADDVAIPENYTGTASYYSEMAHGERTASGEILDKNAMVAAHPFLDLGTVVQVSDMNTGRSIKVRVIDRGPSKSLYQKGVIIILSPAAAQELGFFDKGTAQVKLDVVESGR